MHQVQGAVDSTDQVTCTADEMPSGQYALQATLASGEVLYSAAAMTVVFKVTSVTPGSGSMAGGSILLIAGAHCLPGPTQTRLGLPAGASFRS
jgi:hypothetical protein